MTVHILAQLQTALQRLDDLIQAAVEQAQSIGHDPTDALRGLVISDDEVARHLQRPPLSGLWDETMPSLPTPQHAPLAHLAQLYGLKRLDLYILLIALAPELDRRYERLYAFLQDDVSQRRPSVNLAMNLLGANSAERFAVWERLQAHQPLRRHALLECVPDPSRQHGAFLGHWLRVDSRLVSFVLGHAMPDERLRETLSHVQPPSHAPSLPNTEALLRALPERPLVLCLGQGEIDQAETAAWLCAHYALPVLRLDVRRLVGLELGETGWKLALREGGLQAAALVLEDWDSLLDERRQLPIGLWTLLADYPYPLFLCSEQDWTPPFAMTQRRLLRAHFDLPPFEVRRLAWAEAAAQIGAQVTASELDDLAAKFRLAPRQVAQASQTAADYAVSRGQTPQAEDLLAGARAQSALRLGHLAQTWTPRARWADLILPLDPLSQLREICERLRHQHIVNDAWGFSARAHKGISALFAGDSGTGKTFAAEVIGNELGLPVYKIDLSAVVSKYIGETEKNLSTIFREARAGNAILFFDEADAIFGKRSEVKDARDRYANMEIAYLLQEIEDYDGVVILASNFRQNLDEAFTRRLTFLVDFPFPDEDHREKLWRAHFPPQSPLGNDVDLSDVARRYRLAGGNIRNAAQAAAFLAAADGQIITAAHLRHAIRREHQKMGRLLEERT
jgi:hypothetical protein